MRRFLIFVLLGIITYSTFWSLVPPWPEPDKFVLIETAYGVVSAGNFSYWNLGNKGPLVIELTSVTGDADLFVSDHVRPSYEADRNNFSSETCGVDTVVIPTEFPRPVIIAVFGHWAHTWSEYSMKVYTDLVKLAAIPRAERQSISQVRIVQDKEKEKSRNHSPGFKEKENGRIGIGMRKEDEKPRFLQLFRVLDTMFGLFV